MCERRGPIIHALRLWTRHSVHVDVCTAVSDLCAVLGFGNVPSTLRCVSLALSRSWRSLWEPREPLNRATLEARRLPIEGV